GGLEEGGGVRGMGARRRSFGGFCQPRADVEHHCPKKNTLNSIPSRPVSPLISPASMAVADLSPTAPPLRSTIVRGWRNGSNLRLPSQSVNNEMCSDHIVGHLKSSSRRALMFRPRHTVLRISRNGMKKTEGA